LNSENALSSARNHAGSIDRNVVSPGILETNTPALSVKNGVLIVQAGEGNFAEVCCPL
jgi:hypothetical protein